MIIAQVPACNPLTRYSHDLELAHKTNFVLANLIWDEVDDEYQGRRTSSNFVESKLSLVDYSILRIMATEDEVALRRKLAWESDAAIPKELTNARVIASDLIGTPVSGVGDFAVHQGNLTFVSFETDNVGPGGTAEQRAELNRIVHENYLKSVGEASSVAEDDGETGDVGIPTSVRRPLSTPPL